VLREICKGKFEGADKVQWQQLCKSAAVFVPANANITDSGLIDAVKKDFEFMAKDTVLIRVSALPLGSQVELEFNCDTKGLEYFEKHWANKPVQRCYATLADYEA